MSEERKKTLPGTSRQEEEQHLEETLEVVRENVKKYGEEVSTLRKSIDAMLAHFHDDNPELINELENTYTMYNFLDKTLTGNRKALKKPYFGRIDFHDETLHTDEAFYIGRSGISRDVIHPIVIDWRSPVANTYYENGLGKCSYISPEGKKLDIDLQLKRTYEIEDGKLVNLFDTEVIANDDILTKYLSKNKQAVLGEIVATIQKEQNEIIRKLPYYNCLVQGVAGSGKTTVAMHRISYILYNYAEKFRPEDFYIVGSNRILLNYITGVLPDLDVYGVRQMTMEQLFIRLLYEDWEEGKYRIISMSEVGEKNLIKGRSKWFRDLESFCSRLERQMISTDSIYLNPKQFVEGFVDGKAGVHDMTGGKMFGKRELVLLMDGKAVETYINENPTISIQSKIDMLNERLMIKVKDEFLGKGVKYTEAERKAIVKHYRGGYGSRTFKGSIYTLYQAFLKEQAEKGLETENGEGVLDVYDLAALAYLYKRVKETEVIREAHHVVIDEAQDYGMMAYRVLKFCMKDCTYTIMGDVSQNIHFGSGLNDWEELKRLYLQEERDSFCILKKSYRNTVEISNFATDILHHGRFAVYPVEPIIRHGEKPEVLMLRDQAELMEKAVGVLKSWQKKGLETIAVICRNTKSAAKVASELGKRIEILKSDLETAAFGTGILVLPVEYTKGLEFDAVLILDPTREEYPVDDGHAKLLYVAATRALHELCVLYTGDLTGLIAEPAAKEQVQMFAETTKPEIKPTKKVSVRINREMLSPAKTREEPKPEPVEKMVNQIKAVPKERVIITAKPETTDTEKNFFGDMPAAGLLKTTGHAKVDLAVRWVAKQNDGIYIHSTYGTLRISPVDSRILRVTFAKGNQLPDTLHPAILERKPYREWMYKDAYKLVELKTDDLFLQVEKGSGAITFMTRDKKLLVKEREKESRFFEKMPDGKQQARVYLEWPRTENLYAWGAERKPDIPLKGIARYINQKKFVGKLPLLFSDKGYAMVMATDSAVFACNVTTYGTHLCVENTEVLDFYFLVGKNKAELLNTYEKLVSFD